MAKRKSDTNANKNGATLGFEATLYQAVVSWINFPIVRNTIFGQG
jgi:hypothetical protein